MRRGDQHLNDAGSLYLIIGYFALYTLLLGPGLFYWFRQKARRPYMWGYALSLCGVFAIGVYALDWVVHMQPSRGEIREMILFGPGSSAGVSYATVRLRSCGRQRHVLRAEGNDVSAFAVNWDYRWRAFVPHRWMQPPGPDGSSRELHLNLAPWSGQAFALVGQTRFRSGVSGKATYDKSTQQLHYAIESEVEPPDGRFLIITYNLEGKGALKSHIVRSATPGAFRGMVSASGGNITVTANPSGSGVGAVAASIRGFWGNWSSALVVAGATGPRVLVAWAPPELQPGLALSSEDVLFRQEGTLDPAGRPYREYREFRLIDDGGGPYHLLHQQLIVQEIALEVR